MINASLASSDGGTTHLSSLDFFEQRRTTPGQSEASTQAVVPSWQRPSVHTPGSQSVQVRLQETDGRDEVVLQGGAQ